MNTVSYKKNHLGRNVKHLREMLGIKQEDLADRLNLSQQTVSRIESREEIDSELLEKIAQELNLTPEAIKNFSDEYAVNIMANTFSENSVAFQYNFNPIDIIVELYERILKEKDEKIALLEQFLSQRDSI